MEASPKHAHSAKNFIGKQNFGTRRFERPPWIDRDPVKYGGEYGLQKFRQMNDTSYWKGKQDYEKRLDWAKRQEMTREELEEEKRNLELAEEARQRNQRKL